MFISGDLPLASTLHWTHPRSCEEDHHCLSQLAYFSNLLE